MREIERETRHSLVFFLLPGRLSSPFPFPTPRDSPYSSPTCLLLFPPGFSEQINTEPAWTILQNPQAQERIRGNAGHSTLGATAIGAVEWGEKKPWKSRESASKPLHSPAQTPFHASFRPPQHTPSLRPPFPVPLATE